MDYYKNIDHFPCQYNNKTAIGVQYRVVTDLGTEPVDTDFFKEHARIDFDTDDNLVDSYLKAARQYLESWSQLSFGIKTIGLKALELPDNYNLMHGRVNTVTTTGYTNVGDILKEGGYDIDIEFTTLNWIDETIKIAICRYAAGLYINRENIVDTKFSGQALLDESKTMLQPYRNITLL
jgi:hypothetical protein